MKQFFRTYGIGVIIGFLLVLVIALGAVVVFGAMHFETLASMFIADSTDIPQQTQPVYPDESKPVESHTSQTQHTDKSTTTAPPVTTVLLEPQTTAHTEVQPEPTTEAVTDKPNTGNRWLNADFVMIPSPDAFFSLSQNRNESKYMENGSYFISYEWNWDVSSETAAQEYVQLICDTEQFELIDMVIPSDRYGSIDHIYLFDYVGTADCHPASFDCYTDKNTYTADLIITCYATDLGYKSVFDMQIIFIERDCALYDSGVTCSVNPDNRSFGKIVIPNY